MILNDWKEHNHFPRFWQIVFRDQHFRTQSIIYLAEIQIKISPTITHLQPNLQRSAKRNIYRTHKRSPFSFSCVMMLAWYSLVLMSLRKRTELKSVISSTIEKYETVRAIKYFAEVLRVECINRINRLNKTKQKSVSRDKIE